MHLLVRSVKAPHPNSAFYLTRDLTLDNCNMVKVKCPSIMHELTVLNVKEATSRLVREVLSKSPNLRMLCLTEPRESNFDFVFHSSLRALQICSEKHVELANIK